MMVYTTAEAGELLRVSGRTVLRLIESGRLGAVNIGSPERVRWRVPECELDRLAGRRAA